jgi:hypothetical protein
MCFSLDHEKYLKVNAIPQKTICSVKMSTLLRPPPKKNIKISKLYLLFTNFNVRTLWPRTTRVHSHFLIASWICLWSCITSSTVYLKSVKYVSKSFHFLSTSCHPSLCCFQSLLIPLLSVSRFSQTSKYGRSLPALMEAWVHLYSTSRHNNYHRNQFFTPVSSSSLQT